MKLWTTTVGEGPRTAVLVHGLTCDSGTWFELAPWIAEHGYTVTLVDLPGHGRSPRSTDYTCPALVDALVDTLTGTVASGIDLALGHSLGGRCLLQALERLRPGRAVYLDPSCHVPEGLPLPPPLEPDGTPVSLEKLAVRRPGYSHDHLVRARQALAAFDPGFLTPPAMPLPMFTPPQRPVVPSLVVLPDPSLVVPPQLQEDLARGGYTVQVVPGGVHDLHILNLPELRQVLQDWL